MANCRRGYRQRDPEAMAAAIREATVEVRAAFREPMEEDMPMNRYVSPNSVPGSAGCGCARCEGRETEAMLGQLVELSCSRNQLLIDLLGAVNSLTAALLSVQARP